MTGLIRVLAGLPNLESCHFSDDGVGISRTVPLLSGAQMAYLLRAFAVSNSLQTLSIASSFFYGSSPIVSCDETANALANLLTVNRCLRKLEVTVEARFLAAAILDPLTLVNRTLRHLHVDLVNPTKDDPLLIQKLEKMTRQNDALETYRIRHAKLRHTQEYTYPLQYRGGGRFRTRLEVKKLRLQSPIVQHYLKLNRAGRRQLSSRNATAQDWYRCLEEHKDNINVVFGLLSMDPTLWLNLCSDYLRTPSHPAPSPQALTMGCSTPGCFCSSFSPGW